MGKDIYYDITLSQGLRISCYICQRVTSALIFVHNSEGLSKSYVGINYLDDLVGTVKWSVAFEAFNHLIGLLPDLKIWAAENKVYSLYVSMTFVGILAYTIKMEISLTPDRLTEFKHETTSWLEKDCASKKDIQCLVGKLNFASSTVCAGHLFFLHACFYPNMHEGDAR